MRAFLFAVSFLTRLPMPAAVHQVDDRTLAKGPLWFPFVGALIGLGTGALCGGLLQVFPPPLAVFLALAIEARLTGAMHEDALADTADALGGAWTRERTLEIFKDSRLGTYGVLALVLGILIRGLAMSELSDGRTVACYASLVALASFAGRFQMLVFMKVLPPIRGRESLSGHFGEGLSWLGITLAALPILPLLYINRALGLTPLWIALASAAVLHLLFHRHIKRRLGGSTGDILGAVAFVSQAIALVAFTAH